MSTVTSSCGSPNRRAPAEELPFALAGGSYAPAVAIRRASSQGRYARLGVARRTIPGMPGRSGGRVIEAAGNSKPWPRLASASM